MSSKSRKHSSPSPRKNPGPGEISAGGGVSGPQGVAHAGEIDPDEPSAKDFLEAEELLKTPKGKNPLVYAFLIFLLIFLLIIFILPPDLLSGSGRKDAPALTWNHPRLGTQTLMVSDFQREGIAYSQIFEVATGRRPDYDPNQVASFVLLDALAVEHGVTVSDAELADQLGQIGRNYGSKQNFLRRLEQVQGGPQGFQETLRRFLRAERFRQLAGYLAAVPAADEIKKSWEESYPEFAFEALAMEISAQADAAKLLLPADEGLEAWWNEQPEFERRALYSPETQLAAIPLPSDPAAPIEFDATSLAAAFPLPSEWNAETEADAYYKRNYFRRFKLASVDPAAPDQLYAPFETVKERCLKEAELHQHLLSLLTDLQTRRGAGETIALADAAGQYGLTVLADGQSRSDQEWRELPDLGGDFLLGQLRVLSSPGSLVPTPVVERSALLLAELVARVEPSAPPFADIRSEVETRWISAKQKELAKATLEGLRSELLPEPAEGEVLSEPRTVSAEAFAAAAASRGLTLVRRDFLPREHKAGDDPAYEDPLHEFLRTHAPAYSLAEGALGEIAESVDQTRYVLVRAAGKRPLPLERMKAKQWESLYQQALSRAQFEFSSTGPLSDEALKTRYGLTFLINRDADSTEETPAPETPEQGS
jgi:hypothetical protein